MNTEYTQQMENYQARLNDLLASASLKYSEWPPKDATCIQASAGVYHFYEKYDNHIVSIYVGKAGFGASNTWSLYERMKQHFQPSQKYALLNKASRTSGRSPEIMKAEFKDSNLYLQWVIFATKSDKFTNLEAELRWFECFAISVLKPIYSDA
jgi:hypothetical protein